MSGAKEGCLANLVPQNNANEPIPVPRKTGIPKGLAPGRRFGDFLDEEKVTRSGERNSPLRRTVKLPRKLPPLRKSSFRVE